MALIGGASGWKTFGWFRSANSLTVFWGSPSHTGQTKSITSFFLYPIRYRAKKEEERLAKTFLANSVSLPFRHFLQAREIERERNSDSLFAGKSKHTKKWPERRWSVPNKKKKHDSGDHHRNGKQVALFSSESKELQTAGLSKAPLLFAFSLSLL